MPITEFLARNARFHPDDVSLVEVNPASCPDSDMSWREYSLIQATSSEKYRKEITWKEFNTEANRFANLLLTRGVKKGDKVAIHVLIFEVGENEGRRVGAGFQHQRAGALRLHFAQQLCHRLARVGGGDEEQLHPEGGGHALQDAAVGSGEVPAQRQRDPGVLVACDMCFHVDDLVFQKYTIV